MTLKSQFGGLPPTDFFGPPPPKPKKHHVLHNLLKDAIDTAKGIPFGVVETVRNPIKTGKLIGKSYADTYGQGWDHFKKEFMAHPLQPLLDAISIPLILAGGAGIAIKGTSVVANAGRSAAMTTKLVESSKLAKLGKFAEADALRAEAMRAPRLDAAAQRFRKGTSATTRMVDVPDMPGVSLPKAYSSNLFRRAMTKGSTMVLEGTVGRQVSYFSKENLGRRLLYKEESKRAAATAAASKQQAAVLLGAKKKGLDPDEVINALGDRFEKAHLENALKVDAAVAARLSESASFRSNYEFIYAKAPEKVDAEIFEPVGTHAPITDPSRMLETGNRRAVARGDEPDPSAQGYRTKIEMTEEGPSTRPLKMEGYEHEQMMNAIRTMAKRVETGGDAKRALVENGQVSIVRKGIKDALYKDIDGAATLANKIYRAPVTAWKGIILGMSPRYLVNNVIGNATMYMAATNPVEFTAGVLLAVKSVKGNRAAARAAREMEGTLDGLMAKYMPDDWIHERAGYLQHGALGVEQTAGMRLRHPLRRGAHARLYTITEQVAYRGPQRSALMGALHTDGDFRTMYRYNLQKGMKREDAYRDAANTIFSDSRKAAAMEKRVTDWAGQYYHLNDLEKKITAFVPFYTWDRHALRFGKEQVLSRPVSSVVMAQLGALGDEAADRELGKIPDFMKGAIPVKGHKGGLLGLLLGQNILGRKKVMLTAGLNPLAAAADNAAAIASLFGQSPRDPSEAVGGQVNPVIGGFIAGVTGQRLFSGAKAETHGAGPIGGIYQETFHELPHAKLIRGLLGETPKTTTSKGQPTLYEKGMRQTISSLLGLNERDFSPEAAKRLYNQEHGIKKGRRKKKKDAMTMASQLKSNF